VTAYATDDLEPSPFGERVAPTYDAGSAHMFEPAVLGPTVDVLHELAGEGPALEPAIGTGRVALPLAERRRGPRRRRLGGDGGRAATQAGWRGAGGDDR
jgi:hypothetical protein